MSTSGTRNFDLSIAEIIEEAYERCGLEVRTGYDAETARRSLNLMFADWSNRGVNLWTVRSATQALTQGTSAYTLNKHTVDILQIVLNRDGTDYEMDQISRANYATIPNKTTQGRPSQYYFDRKISPIINVWATPENSTDTLTYYYIQQMEDADYLYNNVEAPLRFYPCMVAGLAYYMAMKRAPDRLQILKSVYEEEFARASDMDQDFLDLALRPSGSYLRAN
jgi:hypothetical protein|tara:strand:- start:1171 stop:1839 length:669 start_codon:yes stop_codon:yes gene_type:complete